MKPDHWPWQDWLAAESAELYKADRRSRVWRIDPATGQGRIVLKRFEYSPLRQRLGWLVRLHPAQHEIRQAERMLADELPVVPLLSWHLQPQGLGCKALLASPWFGQSLWAMRLQKQTLDEDRRHQLLQNISGLVASLIQRGWVFRDLKTANVLVDGQDRPWLIDVGSARKIKPIRCSHAGRRTWRMLRMLDHTLTLDGWPLEERIICLARPLACVCPEPVSQAYDRLARIVLK